ncbi:hypothetical protein ZWY2020_041901 [Hordeum vulgare]|nr:hypothetical protein ZWY2020_041901 [Hordeum vulgare]
MPLKKDASQVKRSKVEIIKEKSNFIRYPLNEELVSEAPNVNETVVELIKFHGSYQQSDREVSGRKNYSFMLRIKNPSGKVINQLYLAMDTLSDEFGIGTLRLTTRQTFQLHGVLKKNLKHVISTVIKNMGSILGACGDLNRNVLAPTAPYVIKDILFAQEIAENIAALLTPQSGTYYDLWVDEEKIMSAEEPPEVTKARNDNSHGTNFPDSPEPIYGTQYLPRKFKIAVTGVGYNSVDILTNDIGVVVVFDSAGEPVGFNLYVGGGMGRTHRIETTFPRLADPLGYIPKEDLLYAIKAIVVTHGENGRRDNRRYSRLKYLLDSWGIDKFWAEAEKYYGKKFEDFRPLPEWQFNNYLGWQEQGDGKLFQGVHIDNGRLGTRKANLLGASQTQCCEDTEQGVRIEAPPPTSSFPPVSALFPTRLLIKYFLRVDIDGLFHTYPDRGGPFKSLQEAKDAIDSHHANLCKFKYMGDLSEEDIHVWQTLYWPNGTRMHSKQALDVMMNRCPKWDVLNALLDKYKEDHHLFGDFAYELKEIVSYKPHFQGKNSPYKCRSFSHSNLIVKSGSSAVGDLFFAEITCMKDGELEEYVLSCICVITPEANGECCGCGDDVKHPIGVEYKKLDKLPVRRNGCGRMPDELFNEFIVVRDEDWLDAEEARVRRQFRMRKGGDGQGMRGRYVIPAKR